MGFLSRSFTGLVAAAGLASASQMPEFAQQYRQRLGGAVEELRVVVEDFDRDAQNSQMTRRQAIDSLKRSKEQFPRDRGNSIERTVDRFEGLVALQSQMEAASPVTQAAYLFAEPDGKLLSETWQAFEPAVPLNAPGAIWGGLGALIAAFLARLPIGAARRMRRRRGGGASGPADAAGRQTVKTHGVHVDQQSPEDRKPVQAGEPIQSHSTGLGEVAGNVLAKPDERKGRKSLLDLGSRGHDPQSNERILGEVDPRGRIVRKG